MSCSRGRGAVRWLTAWSSYKLPLRLTAVVVIFICSVCAQTVRDVDSLAREIRTIAAAADGTVGVTAVHVESGQRVSLNNRLRFPMASVFKFPIAVQLLDCVDRGQVRLEQQVPVRISDLRPGQSPLAHRMPHGGSLTVRELLRYMLVESDNTACDMLLRLAGGAAAVTGRLRALGIPDIDVSRGEGQLALDFSGVTSPPPEELWTPELLDRVMGAVPAAQRRAAAARHLVDPRDTATPDAMAALLIRAARRDLLKPASAALLIDLMTQTITGPARLKGLLPPGTVVAHRTGTYGESTATNDVGIITLSGRSGHVAIAIFMKASRLDLAGRERVMARIARTVYDFWKR